MRDTAGTTAQRLSTLARLYEAGQSSPMMDRTLDKLLAHEAEEARRQLEALDADLATFEQQYAMSSTEFFGRYREGSTDDRMDFVEWASLMQMRENLVRRLELLAGGKAE
jgi:hypothetical protein